MVIRSDKSLICPVLVGRDAQKQRLDSLIEQTGSPAIPNPIVLISGEAGIGKSRLVGESISFAETKGFTILSGRCFEPDRVLPYAPLVDLLRNYCASRSKIEIQHRLGSVSSELVRIFPGINKYFAAMTHLQATKPDQEKSRLLDALTEFFMGFSKPVLIAIEDLHWSDEASLEFLLHFVRRVEDHPILLMMTYRSEAVHPELVQFFTTLNRERRDLIEMPLTRLSQIEADVMIRAVLKLSRATGTNFLEAIYRLTEGNPFFIEEVLKSVTTTEEVLGVPKSLQLVVKHRTDSLSPAARNLLSLAAIAGRRFDFSLLERLTGQDESGLVALIKELIVAQLVVEESSETFAFRHALTREIVYKELLARERKVWHRAIADAMEQQYTRDDKSHLADLAYHFYEAGSWAKALEYSKLAGKEAQDLYAPRAAIEHFNRAIAAASHLATVVPPDLHRSRGQAYEIVGEFEAAIADHEVALQIARTLADQQIIWQSLMDLGMAWTSREYGKAGQYFQEGLELARVMDDPPIVAYSLNRMANWLTNVERPIEGIKLHKEALHIFEQLNDERGMAVTLDTLGTTFASLVDIDQAVSHYRRAAMLFRVLKDRLGLASTLSMLTLCGTQYLSSVSKWAGQSLEQCISDGEEALAIAQETGWRSGEALVRINLGLAFSVPGQYGRAVENAQSGLQISTEIDHHHWQTLAHIVLGAIHLDLLSLLHAREHLEEAMALSTRTGSDYWRLTTLGFLVPTYILEGDLSRAENALGSLPVEMPMETVGQRQAWYASAEFSLAQGDTARALEIVSKLIASTPGLPAGVEYSLPRLTRLRCQALARLGNREEAQVTLELGLQNAASQGAQSLVWRFHLDLARIYHRQRLYSEADDHWAAGRSLIKELAATIPDAGLREIFLRETDKLIRAPSAQRAAKRSFGGLTKREREVAALVGEGKSNREIADHLVVSERTVEKHLQSILMKLGFHSRAQVAVWIAARQVVEDLETK